MKRDPQSLADQMAYEVKAPNRADLHTLVLTQLHEHTQMNGKVTQNQQNSNLLT